MKRAMVQLHAKPLESGNLDHALTLARTLRELPFDQIVELLGTSRSAGYKLLHDARRALKQRLHEAGITRADIQNAFN